MSPRHLRLKKCSTNSRDGTQNAPLLGLPPTLYILTYFLMAKFLQFVLDGLLQLGLLGFILHPDLGESLLLAIFLYLLTPTKIQTIMLKPAWNLKKGNIISMYITNFTTQLSTICCKSIQFIAKHNYFLYWMIYTRHYYPTGEVSHGPCVHTLFGMVSLTSNKTQQVYHSMAYLHIYTYLTVQEMQYISVYHENKNALLAVKWQNILHFKSSQRTAIPLGLQAFCSTTYTLSIEVQVKF